MVFPMPGGPLSRTAFLEKSLGFAPRPLGAGGGWPCRCMPSLPIPAPHHPSFSAPHFSLPIVHRRQAVSDSVTSRRQSQTTAHDYESASQVLCADNLKEAVEGGTSDAHADMHHHCGDSRKSECRYRQESNRGNSPRLQPLCQGLYDSLVAHKLVHVMRLVLLHPELGARLLLGRPAAGAGPCLLRGRPACRASRCLPTCAKLLPQMP